MSPSELAVLTLYYVVLGLLAVYSVHRLHLVRLRRRTPEPPRRTAPRFPKLAVQLPLYNEPLVAARLIDAVAKLDYPGELEIQVLDDSTDETSAIVARCIERLATSCHPEERSDEGSPPHLRCAWCIPGGEGVHRSAQDDRKVRIAHLRRGSRDGYKAGALAHGMLQTDAELFAVFDADFVPARDTLLRMVPYFADEKVGMVQARWTHLNRESSLLTRVQAIYLDAHFAVESAARNFGRRFFNFNGTAGIWRRAAIEGAGGWSASTLTEDLDLSYRAQLKGWEFVFLPDVEVPAELPAALSGFQQQQHRWTKGSIQTARKLLPSIVRGTRGAVTIEALFHLTNNAAYLLTFLLALLVVPSMIIRLAHGWLASYVADAILFVLSTGSVLLFYVEGQRRAGRRMTLRELLAVLPVGVGMSVRNASAVIEGLVQQGGLFRRTPKSGDGPVTSERTLPLAELLLSLFFFGALAAFAMEGRWLALPFLALFAGGYGSISLLSVSSVKS